MYNVYLILPSWHVDLPHNYCSSYNCSALGSGLVWGGFGWCWCPSRGGWYAIDLEMCGWYAVDREMCGWYQSIERCVDGTERKMKDVLAPYEEEVHKFTQTRVNVNLPWWVVGVLQITSSEFNYSPPDHAILLISGYHIILSNLP